MRGKGPTFSLCITWREICLLCSQLNLLVQMGMVAWNGNSMGEGLWKERNAVKSVDRVEKIVLCSFSTLYGVNNHNQEV